MKCPYCGQEIARETLPMDLVLTSERLTLRRFQPTDGEGLYTYLSDPEVVRFEPYEPMDQKQCRQIAVNLAEMTDFWAVCLNATQTLIGQVYLSEREQKTWELGYVLSRTQQGQGLAREAVRCLLNEVFETLGAHRITANCNPENRASWKLLERLNFRREGHLRKNVAFASDQAGNMLWQDTFQYGLLAEEWKP